ncbi:superoxide dismutase family protein [Frankia sp. AgB32]|uniref:superoxide dismutase family protein n=1 Tax=Frankia sp. AgB32 TaxID=631119 RepID=UPI00200E11BD|nr:superoxide dismutase family protein [Frankia sp. AgB32]MCK9894434.1 superoxide dismutase family protein [Frankia sp. AgB32]
MVRGLTRGRAGAGMIGGLIVIAALAAGCGDDTTASGTAAPAGVSAHAPESAHESTTASASATTSMAPMIDPSATPASQIAGARRSTFVLLNTRPAGLDGVRGTAWLAQEATTGTTLTVAVTGLAPNAHYVAHLHAKPCAQDNGGGHFMFDPNGPATPPNEVHLTVDADAAGASTATVTNARPVGDGAKSVVIHPVGALTKRVACADL